MTKWGIYINLFRKWIKYWKKTNDEALYKMKWQHYS